MLFINFGFLLLPNRTLKLTYSCNTQERVFVIRKSLHRVITIAHRPHTYFRFFSALSRICVFWTVGRVIVYVHIISHIPRIEVIIRMMYATGQLYQQYRASSKVFFNFVLVSIPLSALCFFFFKDYRMCLAKVLSLFV